MKSIRKRLLANLLLIFSIAWLLVTIATYFEARHEIEELFDAQLSQFATLVSELSGNNINADNINSLVLKRSQYGHRYERHISFQLWRHGKLLMRSESAPETRISNTLGFSDTFINATAWRVFYMLTDNGIDVYAAEDYKARNEIASDITRDSLYPLLLALPILAISIWFVAGRGLSPLHKLSDEVSKRGADELSVIDSKPVVEELLPLTLSINSLFERLRHAIDRERQFTADAAHELRTPLAGMKAQAQVAMRSSDPVERQQALKKVLTAIDNGAHLIEQMLTLARLDPAHQEVELLPTRFEEIAEQVLSELGSLIVEKNIQLQLSAGDGLPPVSSYPGSMSILLRNLVDNAIRYTPEAGSIDVSLINKNGITLKVCDTGPGVSKDEMNKIYNRFYRPAGHDEYGSGLGLSIVQRIADLHNAKVSFSDNKPTGLCVEVEFPTTTNS